jgi:RNA recognition motif-containing protein
MFKLNLYSLSASVKTRKFRKYRKKGAAEEEATEEDSEPQIRSLGYGFVVFENKADAEKAVLEKDQKDWNGRPVKVALALPREELAEKPKRGRGPKRSGRRKSKAASKDTAGNAFADAEEANGGDIEDGPVNETPAGKAETKKRKPKKKAQRPRDQPVEYSKTMVYVRNVAFSVTNEELSQFFTDNGVKVANARLIISTRSKTPANRGYGYVELASEEDQKKAIEELNEKELKERPLLIRAAYAIEKSEE